MGKVAVIGAGISGATCARLLKQAGHDVVVFEKNAMAGGLVKCTVEDGNLFHRVGGHVFNSKDKRVSDWFWSNFDKENEFLFATRNAAIHLKNRFIGYPIEQHLYQMSSDDVATIIPEILNLAKNQNTSELSDVSFYDFLQSRFGETLCSDYFIPYNTKIWNVDLRSMPISWLAGKLPMPTVTEIIVSNIRQAREQEMVHSQFYYPKDGGSQFIVNRILREIDVRNNEDCVNIGSSGAPVVNGLAFDAIVYTGDARALSAITGSQHPSLTSLSKLKSNGTTTVLCTCDENPYSWLYIPDPDVKCHRMIMTGNFSPNNNSPKILPGRTTCTVEFVGEIDQATIDATLSSLPFNPKQVASNFEPRSYVIQDQDTRALISSARGNLKESKIWLCGRFAEWEYFNMDAAIASAMSVVEEIQGVID